MVGTGRANERERERIAALRSYEVLDTPPAPTFDDLVQLASDICGVPIALVSLVDEDRQWFKAKVGLTVNETKRNVAFCTYTIEQDDVFTVKDATHDPRFALNPLVLSDPHIRFYAGAPLRTQNGYALGSLCVIDRVPRELTALQQNALVILARQVTAQLELHRAALELARREADISRQHDAIVSLQHQKDHLIAHVVHDLKSPLTSILLNAASTEENTTDSQARETAADISKAATRMHEMVNDMLRIAHADDATLVPVLEDIDLAELLTSYRGKPHSTAANVRASVEVEVPARVRLRADPRLVTRVLDNLVDNAFKYGASHVALAARVAPQGELVIDVADDGNGIPAGYHDKIFERYARLDRDVATNARIGEGLGLTFCRMAMHAHGGSIRAMNREEGGALFQLRFPGAASLG